MNNQQVSTEKLNLVKQKPIDEKHFGSSTSVGKRKLIGRLLEAACGSGWEIKLKEGGRGSGTCKPVWVLFFK